MSQGCLFLNRAKLKGIIKLLNFCLGVFISILLVASCSPQSTRPATITSATNADATTQIKAIVEDFGKQLQTVSLQSPNANEEMHANYTPFIAPELLEKWMNDLSTAPGRIVSSPWPDRIEITSITQQTPTMYLITGDIIEVTSLEAVQGGAANEIPVQITVENVQGNWLITGFETASYQP